MATTVTASSGEELKEIVARSQDARSIGTIVARILESQAQRAFPDQRLGDFDWPERYPSQEDPFVNIAALVRWTTEGGTIQSRFFDRRPALMATGALAQSIQARVKDKLVEVGSSLPYAGIHQWGGSSMQTIGEGAKAKIGKFIGEEKVNGEWRRRKRLGARQKENREKYWFKLRPLLSMETLETEVNQRPFLGITTQGEQEMAEDIEGFVARGTE